MNQAIPFRLYERFNASARIRQALRGRLFETLKSLRGARLLLREDFAGGETFHFGPQDAAISAELRVHDPAVYTRIALGGDIGAGEAYVDGLWDSPDLEAVVRAFLCDDGLLDRTSGALARLVLPLYRALHRSRRNAPEQARRNIQAHYDLGNDFYRLWLDERMLYSCGIYPSPAASLEQAQLEKMDRICRKLRIEPGMRLLEIGTGWGALAIHAAQHYGAQVVTTTISDAQRLHAIEQVKALGLEDRVRVLGADYRALSGQYDRIVSVEMIEAVGHEYLETYVGQLGRLLKPDGRALIQAITITCDRYDSYRKSTDFINQYIFPGGCLPSITAIQQAVARHTHWRLDDLEDIGLHYATTLRDWHRRLRQNRDQLPQANRDARFMRLWEYYLLSCAGAFSERRISTVQLSFAGARADRAPVA